MRNCRHFWVVLGGPAQWCHTQIGMRPRRPCVLRTVKLTPLSGAPGRPNAVVSDAHQKKASPSLGAANCQAVATVPWSVASGGSLGNPGEAILGRFWDQLGLDWGTLSSNTAQERVRKAVRRLSSLEASRSPGVPRGVRGGDSWGLFGASWGPLWSLLGASWGPLKGLLGASRGLLGASWGRRRPRQKPR